MGGQTQASVGAESEWASASGKDPTTITCEMIQHKYGGQDMILEGWAEGVTIEIVTYDICVCVCEVRVNDVCLLMYKDERQAGSRKDPAWIAAKAAIQRV